MDYIYSFIPERIRNIPTHMDFDGQRRAEKYFQIIILLFAAVGFIWGYITQMFSHTLYILFTGVIISSVLTLIPWGMYRRNPLKWQPARDKDGNTASRPAIPAPQSQNKPKKKKLKD
ncbi:unnamed protein product [Candidula unifasciata]|uniref:Signal peptidase complex subunit 1 n=1 Tax=Candidula unifasciata TaxID=100452 RepID=A0A8S4A2K9_9EUPU|nr:unnamed protein product [Candidula unifasciata]